MPATDANGESLRCLWLARALPLPLSSGENVYTARLAQALAAVGASVTFMGRANPAAPLLQRAKEFESRIEWSRVPSRPKPTVVALASPLPFAAARFDTRDYAQQLEAMLGKGGFDAVILDNYPMSWAIDRIRGSKRDGVRPLITYVAHNFETKLGADIARNFRGDLFRRVALWANGRKMANAERRLVRAADIIVTLTPEDAACLAPLSRSVKLVLPPGYDGPPAPERQLKPTTPRRVAVVGSWHWTAKQINLVDFLAAADPILQNAGVGLDIVGEMPDPLRKACDARGRAARFYGFVDTLGEFLAARRMGLVIEETGGGFKLKALDYIFNRVPIAAIKGSMAGLPLTAGLDYLSFQSMQELAHGVVAVIDDIERLNAMQQAAYAKCEHHFDWNDRGRILCNAIRQAVVRRFDA